MLGCLSNTVAHDVKQEENYRAAGLFGPSLPDDGVLALGPLAGRTWVYAEADPARVPTWRQEGAVPPFTHWPEPVIGMPPPSLVCGIVDLR
ncbi:hypothetical protein [Sphingobium nicotianae]|uniref:Uncharacterized protein n=1 Tax=Sphingobium nicotianae TaxID=2782607 RepID=A0A9X1AIX9_9SPHN|nr:hypothetical protein [Sphingobium nicotianae]MBT2185620.1 hypothetical protein [Sphingobium nicotianae]